MERQALDLAIAVQQAGIPIWVLTRHIKPSWEKNETIRGISVKRYGPNGSSSQLRWKFLFSCLVPLWKQRKQYDIIFVPGFRALGLAGVMAAILLRKGCILKADSRGEMSGDFFRPMLQKHMHKPLISPAFSMFMFLRNAFLKRANAFVSLSSEMTQEYKDTGIHPNKIKMIPNAIDTSIFHTIAQTGKAKLRQQLGLEHDATYITYTGRLASYKGVLDLATAVRSLKNNHPKVRLLFIGEGGADIHACESQLRTYVKEHHLSDVIQFTGFVDHVEHYLQASDIFAFPTQNEAFGLSIIEAMACGLPCISTAVGGLYDIVIHNENALVIEPEHPEQLEAAIETLLCSPSIAAKLSKRGVETVSQHYVRDQVSQDYVSLFLEIS